MTKFMGRSMTTHLMKTCAIIGLALAQTQVMFAANSEVGQAVGPVRDEGFMAMLSNFMQIMRGDTASVVMWWINLFVLLFLLYRFVFPLVLKMLEDSLNDIETTLSSEEAERRKIEDQKAELKQSIENIQAQRSQMIEDAHNEAATIKKDILGEARDMEMRILDNVEKNATGYYLKGLNELKNRLYGQVNESFIADHCSKSTDSDNEKFSSKAILKIGS